MYKFLLALILSCTCFASFGQGHISDEGTPGDTTHDAGSWVIDEALRMPSLADPDSLYVLAADANGRLYLKLVSGGGGGAVNAVFGRAGNVIAQAGDYAAFYASLTGSYANPSWITSLAFAKITGMPSYLILTSLSANSGISYNNSTGVFTLDYTYAGTFTNAIWHGTAIADGYIASAATWNAKQSALTFSAGITNSSGSVTLDYTYAGTFTNTTWHGVPVADAYISSASTWNAKQAALNGTGFVKISGTTISYDNSTYLTTETDPVANAHTITIGGGYGILGGGAAQALSTNPSRTLYVDTSTLFTYFATTLGTGSGIAIGGRTISNTGVLSLNGSTGVLFFTTLGNYGITDAYTKTASDARFAPISITGTVTSVTGTSGNITSTGGATPVINLATAGTAGTNGTSTTIPVFVTDAYGRVTSSTNTAIGTLNQNTTGSAAKWTTARLIANNSVDGSADATFANKFIVQGTSDAGLTGAQFLGGLGTGIIKNTTSTGVLSIAIAADFPTFNQSTTGSAATLTTTRTLWGQNFNGSANVSGDITLGDANLIAGTTTGIKIGTATSQKIGFYNATPVVQQSGDILTAFLNYGLGTLTIAAGDIPTLNQNTTGSAGTLTTSRTIFGQSFNGSANVTGSMTATSAVLNGSTAGTFTILPAASTTSYTWIPPSSVAASTGMVVQVYSISGTNVYTSWGTIAGGGGVAGSDKQVQINNAGVAGATGQFTYDISNNVFSMGSVVPGGNSNGAGIYTTSAGRTYVGDGGWSTYMQIYPGADVIILASNNVVLGGSSADRVVYTTGSPNHVVNSANLLFNGTVFKTSHIGGTTSAPTIAAGTGAGTSPTVSIGSGSTDISGYVNVTTGTSPSTSATVATITFNTAYAAAPHVTLTPANSSAALLSGVTNVFVDQATGVNTTTFIIKSGTTALTASTAYQFWYTITQ